MGKRHTETAEEQQARLAMDFDPPSLPVELSKQVIAEALQTLSAWAAMQKASIHGPLQMKRISTSTDRAVTTVTLEFEVKANKTEMFGDLQEGGVPSLGSPWRALKATTTDEPGTGKSGG